MTVVAMIVVEMTAVVLAVAVLAGIAQAVQRAGHGLVP